MTASRLDPRRGRTSPLLSPLLFTLLAACHSGLPPEPPGADAADPNAAAAPYQVQANPYETSAFAGEQPAKTDPHAGHGNMNHGATVDPHAGHKGMDHGSGAASKPAPTPAAPTGHEGTNHGSGAGSNPNVHNQVEPPR